MKIERKWAMPNRWTFKIYPIRDLLRDEVVSGVNWCDPFSGKNSPAEVKNDLVEKADYNMDALEFLRSRKDGEFQGVLYDPPYSITQARKYGSKKFASMKYWKECKDEVARITKKGGKVICFGWSSQGMGKGRGFDMKQVLIIPHGGSKNDTIVTVETKI